MTVFCIGDPVKIVKHVYNAYEGRYGIITHSKQDLGNYKETLYTVKLFCLDILHKADIVESVRTDQIRGLIVTEEHSIPSISSLDLRRLSILSNSEYREFKKRYDEQVAAAIKRLPLRFVQSIKGSKLRLTDVYNTVFNPEKTQRLKAELDDHLLKTHKHCGHGVPWEGEYSRAPLYNPPVYKPRKNRKIK